MQVRVQQAVFESAAIVMESHDSFPGKFPFIVLGIWRWTFACARYNAILCTTFLLNDETYPTPTSNP